MSELIVGQIEESYKITNGSYEDLPRSTLPVQIDNIDEMQDITADLLELQNQFYSFINAGNLAGAKTLLNNNPQLLPCLFNADKYNALRDTIVALQRMFLGDIEDYIMNISQPKGEWKEDVVYKKYDVVSYIYEDATQFYCARVMEVPINTLPTNTDYWTPVTLRGMRGHTGLGLTPSGDWSETEQYYNFVDENGIPHVSMVYEQNKFWIATTNNINSQPTASFDKETQKYTSTNPDWDLAMYLDQAASGIIFDDNKTLAEIREGWDALFAEWNGRLSQNMESMIGNDYSYYAIKESTSPLIWHEYVNNNTNNAPFSETISTKVSDNEWQIHKKNYDEVNPIDFTIRYIKDAKGNWKGIIGGVE